MMMRVTSAMYGESRLTFNTIVVRLNFKYWPVLKIISLSESGENVL